ncbi:TPA: restriction endonuclease subunit S [Escherichia coli]|uniref:restriction endonuclease subunit S n=1 Tax=Escherichia coli TaxID=562 RepID=UPI0018110562|nr:restriction endonuclease subunit S [Escherichia coli]MBS8869863.1 restriction endonuclease subunit S [Escherichia coli]HDH9111097.1 restriction endonuclease subunit S [Escherichia coli]
MSAGKLPEGWVPCKLGDTLLKIVGGGTPSKAISEYYQGDIPWMSVKDMNKHTLTDTVDHITPDAVKNSSTNIIPAGIPIIATRMSLGKIVTASFDSAINQDLKALFLANGIERNFFLHWYRSQAQLIENLGTGTTVKGIRLEVLNSLQMKLPPLAEQKIIAEKLDTLLAQVDSTKARLEQIPQILKRFRQAVLGAAVSGTLTKTWRKNKEYECDSIELGALANFIDYRGKTPTKTDSGIPLITAKNIRQGYISQEPREYIAEADYDKWMTRGIPNIGDVLITTEAPMGYIANVNIEGKFALAQRAICLQFNGEINSFFASIYMQSSIFQQKLNENATGSTVKGIKAALLKRIVITFPPLPEQHEIVRRVEQLFAYADTIEKQVNNALARVNNLTQSILAKAFRGELTAQWRAENPELISGENSAAALLEKIKTERAASGGKKASRKKS